MLQFNYSLMRDEGLYKSEYKPNKIPQKLTNLVYIKAPNTTGKSTLLNIIALGLFGNNNKRIDPAIKKKISSLSDVNHQVLNAEFTIEDKNGNKELHSTIRDGKPHLIKIVNGKEQAISSDRFEAEYNLIYDLPTNPTERLKELTYEIELYQERLGNQILRFSDYLSRMLQEISDSQDPGKITQLSSQISRLQKELERLTNTKQQSEERYDKLKRFVNLKYYIFYRDKIKDTEKNIAKITKDQEAAIETKTKKIIGSQKLFLSIKMSFSKINSNRIELTKDLVELLSEEEISLDKWKHYPDLKFEKIEEYIEDFDEGLSLKSFSHEIYGILIRDCENDEYKAYIREYEIYREIIKFFEDLKRDYKGEEIIIPGVETSIQEFIDILIENNQENAKIHQKIDLIKNCLKKLETIENEIDYLKNNHFIELIKYKNFEITDVDTPEKMDDVVLKNLKDDLKEYNKIIANYKNTLRDFEVNELYVDHELETLLKKELSLKSFVDYTEKQLKDELKTIEGNISSLQSNIHTTSGNLHYNQKELERIKTKKVHPFHKEAEKINILAKNSRMLAQIFLKNYSDYLNDLKEQIPENKIDDAAKSRYYKELGLYFGKKIHNIIYNGVPQKVQFVDLIHEVIEMNSGLKAKFIDFGTGESQATYLKSVLETSRNDKRKLIVLFDEVGMIDDIRLDQVIESLKRLYEEEKLLLGIIVQKGTNVEIIDLV